MAIGLYNDANARFEDRFSELFSVALQSLGQTVPVAIVVLVVAFLFFWGAAPIRGGLRIGQVIGRSVWCALGVGVVLAGTFFVQFLVIVSSPAQAQYGPPSKHDLLRNAGESSLQAIDFFLQTITLVVLAGVLLWHWMRTRTEPAPV